MTFDPARPVRAFFTAVMFLTRVRVPAWVGYSESQLASSTVYFPLVGALVGLVGACTMLLTAELWSTRLAALFGMAATILLTGAFHEDGTADSCDGLGGGWRKDQILRIMKDSRVGTYGVVGLWLLLTAKWALLSELSPGLWIAALVLGHSLGRWSSLPLIWRYDYVREEGTGKPFADGVTSARLLGGTACLGVALAPAVLIFGLHPQQALAAFLAACGLTALSGFYFHRRLGGITGDCLGAANQLVELAVYLTLSVSFWSPA